MRSEKCKIWHDMRSEYGEMELLELKKSMVFSIFCVVRWLYFVQKTKKTTKLSGEFRLYGDIFCIKITAMNRYFYAQSGIDTSVSQNYCIFF